MRVLVAMSGGVDSSVAAALLAEAGHQVVGATMKLWGGPSDSGCCSVADVDDARRVAQQLGIAHRVFNFTHEFDRDVVDPYVAEHAAGHTPNPCVACNRHLKFDRFLVRADQLGFDAIATGHHARVTHDDGRWQLRRGVDGDKDQSYVLHMLGQAQLARLLLPVGEMTKSAVRQLAGQLGLRTAAKPDSQDVCFISKQGGRSAFLGTRIPLRPGRLVDTEGKEVGTVEALQLVTVGQRRGLGPERPSVSGGAGPERPSVSGGAGPERPSVSGTARPERPSSGAAAKADRRYALDVDIERGVVTMGSLQDLLTGELGVGSPTWVDEAPAPGRPVEVQVSAHGRPVPGVWRPDPERPDRARVVLNEPLRRVAPGQSVVLYHGDAVLGGGVAR